MAYKTLIFGTDDIYPKLKPFYDAAVEKGTLEIVNTVDDVSKLGGDNPDNFDLAMISSKSDFYRRMKKLEELGFPCNRIIDGRVFNVPNFDFPRLLKERVVYATLEKTTFGDNSRMIYPKVYTTKNGKITLSLAKKSYIRSGTLEGTKGLISLGSFSSFANKLLFNVGQNYNHNYRNVSTVPSTNVDWEFPKEFLPPQGTCKILIGSDVWAGRGCILKSANPEKPLVVGDGAIIASDSVVVKNVPPYAIVGGNPAQVIKYRFEPHIIEALLRIKWWDWSLDKIHDNFKYFNDVEKFVSLHDPLLKQEKGECD